MKNIPRTGCIFKGERLTAYIIDEDWYRVQTPHGAFLVHHADPNLGLVGPLMPSENEEALQQVNADVQEWCDRDDLDFYTGLLERLHPDSICLHGHRYHVYDADECQRYVDQNGLNDYLVD